MRRIKTLILPSLILVLFTLHSGKVIQAQKIVRAVDNLIEATMSQKYDHSLIGNKGDFVLTSTNFSFTEHGLRYQANEERFQRAVLMRTANGDRWRASFELNWLEGSTLGAGLYFAYDNMASFYYIGVDGQYIYVLRNGKQMARVRFQAQKNKWLKFRIRRKGNTFKAWIDNVPRLEFEEDRPLRDNDETNRNPLPNGGYALGTDDNVRPGTVVLFRNLRIEGSPSKKNLKHAYVESIDLRKGKKNVIIWLHKMDDRASNRARVLAKAIKTMENISGLSYPERISAEVVSIDYKSPFPFRKYGQAFFPDVNTILSKDKTQDFLSIIAQQWDYFQELWLVGGFPLFLSGAASQNLEGKPFIFKNVPAFKRALDKMNDKEFKDVAVDGVYVGPEDVYHKVVQGKEFYAEKGSLFLFMIYRDLGEKKFAEVTSTAVKNLSGKRYKRSQRISSEDFLEAVVDVTQTRYKPYFNGWVFSGKYQRWTPAFFVDHDKDGLLLMEEKIVGTSDDSVDTDKDGYTDAWEYLNGFDPKDKSKPKVNQIAVDGYAIDWSNFDNIASVDDPVNDAAAVFNPYDVRRLMMRADNKFLYIGVQFHSDIRLNTKQLGQKFIFRFDGKDYSYGTIEYDGEDFIAQRLKGKDLWYDYFSLDKGFLIEFGLDMEVKIPLDYFNSASRIQLQYAGPGEEKGNKVNLEADKVLPIEIFRMEKGSDVRYLPLQSYQSEIWGFGVESLKSTGHNEENIADRAIDLRKNTFWQAKHPGDWIQLNMDKIAKAKNISLSLDPSIQYQLKVEISRDQEKWLTVIQDKQLQQSSEQRIIPLQKMEQFKEEFKYIRIHILKTSYDQKGKLYEIEFTR